MIFLLIVLGFLIAPFYIIYKPPGFVIDYFQRSWPAVIWHVSTSKKIVALTIDDAPSEYTSGIVKLLDTNNAAATFFVIGSQVEGREEALEHIVRHGNELGNHAMHDEPSRSLSNSELAEQVRLVHAKIDSAYTAAGIEQRQLYFRPGSGFFSTRMLENVAKLGYRLVLGSIYPHDPQISYWRINAAHILSMVRPGGIIICHDRRSWTIPMLEKVLPELKRRGYKVVTVSELMREMNHA
jgi:peptidoglycan/xylan/chitin deacetylase (PgdA/CDA1 family)